MSDVDPVSGEMPQAAAGTLVLERIAKALGTSLSNFHEQGRDENTEAAVHAPETLALLHLVQAYLRRSKAEERKSFAEAVRAMADEELIMPQHRP